MTAASCSIVVVVVMLVTSVRETVRIKPAWFLFSDCLDSANCGT